MHTSVRGLFGLALCAGLASQNPQYATFATGCSGSLPTTHLTALSPPSIGVALRVDLDNLPANLAFMFTGWSRTVSSLGTLPFALGPYGMAGCFANVSTESNVLVLGSGNRATYSLTIPPSAGLVGARFYQQAVVLDPGAGNPLGAVMSDAAEVVVGLTGFPTGGTPVPNMVPISAGSFQMGSTVVGGTAVPVHTVTITRPFWIGKYEVTQAGYQAIMGSNPSWFQGASRPVENVSWNQAVTYCATLTSLEAAANRLPNGYVYRLPTEAEWEYCCRAGTATEWNVGNSFGCGVANFYPHPSPICVGQTTVVGSYAANPWGLHDMHGNVWEWCLDWWDGTANYSAAPVSDPYITSGTIRIYRGGSYGYNAVTCRSAYRQGYFQSYSSNSGFRVVLAPALVPPSGANVYFVDFAPADSNYVDASLTQTLPFLRDIDHDVPAPTFYHQPPPATTYGTPVAWASVGNNSPAAQSCRLEYFVTESTSGLAVAIGVGGTFSIPAWATSREVVDSSVQQPNGFPNLSALPAGGYSVTARLLVETPLGSGTYIPTTGMQTRNFRITTTTPVILVHGICGDATTFGRLEELLETEGALPGLPACPALPVRRFLYSSQDGTTAGLDRKADELATFISQAGYTTCNFVAHSMGGLIVRQYLGRASTPASHGSRLVFLGTPHFGASNTLRALPQWWTNWFPNWASCQSGTSSQVWKDLTAASFLAASLADSWTTTASSRFTLNIVGVAGQGTVGGDGVVGVDEAYLPPSICPVMNIYVPDWHVGTNELANYAVPNPAAPKAGLYLMRDFLTSAVLNPVLELNSAIANRPANLTTFWSSFTLGTGSLWIPCFPGVPIGPLDPSVGDALFNWDSNTIVWCGVTAASQESLFTHTVHSWGLGILVPVPPPVIVLGGRLRRCDPVSGGAGLSVTLQANTSQYPY